MTNDTTPTPTSAAEPLVGDDQIINSVYQLTYRVVDAIALQEMRAMMYKLRDRYEARIAELQSQLDAARAGQWTPVPDGVYTDPARVRAMVVKGKTLRTAYDYDPGVEVELGEGVALCRLQPASAGSEGTVQDG